MLLKLHSFLACCLTACVRQRVASAGIGMLINPHMHRQAPRRAPSPPRYTVTTNGSTARVLCKGCRNPIPQNCTQIGYSERGQMRWYHLGCLSGDRWQAAAAPGRLSGLPQLHPNQQVLLSLSVIVESNDTKRAAVMLTCCVPKATSVV